MNYGLCEIGVVGRRTGGGIFRLNLFAVGKSPDRQTDKTGKSPDNRRRIIDNRLGIRYRAVGAAWIAHFREVNAHFLRETDAFVLR